MEAYKNRLIDILSNAYSGIRKEMWVLAIAMLINRSGSMVLLFMSVYLTKQKHFTIAEAGFIMGLFGAGSFVGAFVGGKLVDRIGFYPILISSLVLSAVCMISLAYVDHFFWIGLLTFLVTSTGDMFRPANAASISTYSEPENYPQSIALNRLAMNIGFTLGPVIGGILASCNYTFLFWADGLTCISAAFFLWWQLPGKKQIKIDSKGSQYSLSPYQDRHYLLFLLFTTLYAMAFFQLLTTLPLYYKNVYHLGEKHIGWLMALNGIGVAVIEMFLIYYLKNKWTSFKWISLGAILLIGSYLLLMLTHSIWILILNMILLTFSEMFAMPFMSTHSMKKSEHKNAGDYMALYAMSWSTALILAPVIGSQIIEHWGYPVLWMVVSGFGLLSYFGFRYLEKIESTR